VGQAILENESLTPNMKQAALDVLISRVDDQQSEWIVEAQERAAETMRAYQLQPSLPADAARESEQR
jgi:hypothetical protein